MIVSFTELKANVSKKGRYDNLLLNVVYLVVVSKYAEKFCGRGMKRCFFEMILNRFKMEGAELRVIPSIEEQRTFMQDNIARRNETDVKVAGVKMTGILMGWCLLLKS